MVFGLKKLGLFLVLPLGICLSACTTQNEPAALLKPNYFDLESLLQKNINQLTAQQAGVKKTGAAGNGTTETETIAKVNWARELELFSQAAINRPSWRGDFATDTTRKPAGQQNSYTHKTEPHNVLCESC